MAKLIKSLHPRMEEGIHCEHLHCRWHSHLNTIIKSTWFWLSLLHRKQNFVLKVWHHRPPPPRLDTGIHCHLEKQHCNWINLHAQPHQDIDKFHSLSHCLMFIKSFRMAPVRYCLHQSAPMVPGCRIWHRFASLWSLIKRLETPPKSQKCRIPCWPNQPNRSFPPKWSGLLCPFPAPASTRGNFDRGTKPDPRSLGKVYE